MFSRSVGLGRTNSLFSGATSGADDERIQKLLSKKPDELTPADHLALDPRINLIKQQVSAKKDETIKLKKIVSAYQDFKSVCSKLSASLAPLRKPARTSDSSFELRQTIVTTNDNISLTYLKASAQPSAAINSYQVYISKLATSSRVTIKPATVGSAPTPYTTSTYPVVEATHKALKFGVGNGKFYACNFGEQIGFSANSAPYKDKYAVNFTVGQSLDSVYNAFNAVSAQSKINVSLNNTGGNIYRLTFTAANPGNNNNMIILDDANGDTDEAVTYLPTDITLGVNLFAGEDGVASTLTFGASGKFNKGLMPSNSTTIVTKARTANKFTEGDVYLFQDSSGTPQAAWDMIAPPTKEDYKYSFDSVTKYKWSNMTVGSILTPPNSGTEIVNTLVAGDSAYSFDFKGTTDNIYLFDGVDIKNLPNAVDSLDMLEEHSGGNHYIRFGIDKVLVDPFSSSSAIVKNTDVAGFFKNAGTPPIYYKNGNFSVNLIDGDNLSNVITEWNKNLSGSGLTVTDVGGFITITEDVASGTSIEISNGTKQKHPSLTNVAYVSKTGSAQTTFSAFFDFDITGTTGGGPPVDYFFEDINTTPVVTTVATDGKLTAGDLYIYQGNWATLNGLTDKNSYKITLANGDKLQNVVNKINNISKKTKVNASIISVSTTDHRLQLSSTNTGADCAIKLYDTNGADGAPLITSKMDITDNTPQDAEFRINGLDLVRSSNTVTDAIDGLTLNLLEVNTDNTKFQTVTVETGKDQIIQQFVRFAEAYGEFRLFVANQTDFDTKSTDTHRERVYKETAVLHSHSLFKNIVDNISREVYNSVTQLSASDLRSLSDVGFQMIDVPANSATDTPEIKQALFFENADLDTALSDNGNDWNLIKQVFEFSLQCNTSGLSVVAHTKNISRNDVKITVNTAGVAGAPNSEEVKLEFYDKATGLVIDHTEYAKLETFLGSTEKIITPQNSIANVPSVIDGLLLRYTANQAPGVDDVFDHVYLYQGIADRLYNILYEATALSNGLIDRQIKSLSDPSIGSIAVATRDLESILARGRAREKNLTAQIARDMARTQTAKHRADFYEQSSK